MRSVALEWEASRFNNGGSNNGSGDHMSKSFDGSDCECSSSNNNNGSGSGAGHYHRAGNESASPPGRKMHIDPQIAPPPPPPAQHVSRPVKMENPAVDRSVLNC